MISRWNVTSRYTSKLERAAFTRTSSYRHNKHIRLVDVPSHAKPRFSRRSEPRPFRRLRPRSLDLQFLTVVRVPSLYARPLAISFPRSARAKAIRRALHVFENYLQINNEFFTPSVAQCAVKNCPG